MKVLALGYVPKWRGGRQTTGLATGLFDLHDAVNALHQDVEVVLAATDIFVEEKVIDHTRVLGWSPKQLFLHAIKHINRLGRFISGAFALARIFGLNVFFQTLGKLIFLDYAIEREQPDIIHLHGCVYGLYRPFLWDQYRPVVLRIHGVNGFDETIPKYQKYKIAEQKITSEKFDFVTFVTSSICAEWKDNYGSFNCPMVPILNGYNSNVFFPCSENHSVKYDLITISGLSARKGQLRVLEALAILQEEGINYRYAIVGKGSDVYQLALHNYASTHKLAIDFYDYCSQREMNEYLWNSRFFILPSASEGFGKVFIESIAAGTPVILPKQLPIALEKDVLSSDNAVMMDDSSAESIAKALRSLSNIVFDKNEVVASIKNMSWNNIAKQYIEQYKMIQWPKVN